MEIEQSQTFELKQEENDDSTCKGDGESQNSAESKLIRMNKTRIIMRGYLIT